MARQEVRSTVEELLGRLPGPGGERSTLAFERGTLTVKLYAPRGSDPQTPHTRDELYVVHTGRGRFVVEDRSVAFGPGDALWVAAGVPHRFEDFTDDLSLWVVFYGPDGGEG
jgi:mannose-6-phosphate isomerase-like protein (cupin superfamily)